MQENNVNMMTHVTVLKFSMSEGKKTLAKYNFETKSQKNWKSANIVMFFISPNNVKNRKSTENKETRS